jgi:Holliday junction DNA helicase RuvA
MIGRLRGTVVHEEPGSALILDVGGVGYELNVPLGAVGRARSDRADDSIVLHVHTHVREDALELFGFPTELERRVFRLLIGISGVGPKTALALLSTLPPPELSRAVRGRDLARLSKVPGIGKKTAERLVLELKDKLVDVETATEHAPAAGAARPDDSAKLLNALTNMGYRASEADRAIATLGDQVGTRPLAELLRDALAHLAR